MRINSYFCSFPSSNENWKKWKMYVLVVLAPIVIGAGSIPVRAYAQGIDLSLSPPIIEIVTTAGSNLKVPITLTNHADRKQEVSLSLKPFTLRFEDDTLGFTDDSNLDPIRRFLSVTKNAQLVGKTMILRPNETSDLNLSVEIPREAAAQDYYFTIIFQSKKDSYLSQSSQTNALSNVEAGVGSNVLLSIRNPDTPDVLTAKLKEFSTVKVTESDSIRLKAIVENQGSHFIKAKSKIVFKDIRGGEVKSISLPIKRILAASQRNLIDEAISLPVLFGKYTAVLSIDIDDSLRLTDTISFYVMPKNSLIAISLLILALFLIIIRRFQWYAKQARMKGFSS